MPPHDRCIVGCGNNDKRYHKRMIVHSNVKMENYFFTRCQLMKKEKKLGYMQ